MTTAAFIIIVDCIVLCIERLTVLYDLLLCHYYCYYCLTVTVSVIVIIGVGDQMILVQSERGT